jgi:hypothetical protein
MRLCDIGVDITKGVKKHVIIWLASSGVIMFDGVSLTPISDDIKNYFDQLDSNCVNASYIHLASAVYDTVEQEYHLFLPTGAATSCNKELVYSLKRRQWFEIVRGTATKFLQCAFNVEDSVGNKYVYGGTTDGFIERLENGTTFDGNSIVYDFREGDIAPTKKGMVMASLEGIQLIGKTKSTTAQNVAFTHYGDGATSGVSLTAQSQKETGKRIYRRYQPATGQCAPAIFHSIECSITTTDETVGFEPLLLSHKFVETEEVFI